MTEKHPERRKAFRAGKTIYYGGIPCINHTEDGGRYVKSNQCVPCMRRIKQNYLEKKNAKL